MAPKQHGGWRQRCEAEAATHRERSRSPTRLRVTQSGFARDFAPSAQAEGWLLDWCYGNITAHAVQKYAQNALLDGSRHPTVLRLAKLGSRGASKHNCQSQLMRWFKDFEGIKMIKSLENSLQNAWIPPDALFSFLHRRFPDCFRRNLGAHPTRVRQFWEDLFSTAAGREFKETHPWLRSRSVDDLSFTLPLATHCDAGPPTKTASVFFLSVSSLLGVGSELESQLVISNWLKPTDSILDEGVWAPLFLAFQRLAEGVGEDGKPLCQDPNGGPCWKGLWCFHFADMEFLANNLGMRGASHNSLCTWCGAERGSGAPFTDLSFRAAWTRTICSNAEFLSNIRTPLHGMVQWPWFNKFSCRLDPLHIMDYRGVGSHIAGNIFWHFVSSGFPGCANQAESLDALNLKRIQFQKATGVQHRLPSIEKTSFFGNSPVTTSFPILRGPGIKASNTRCCASFVLSLAQELSDQSPQALRIRGVAEGWDGYLRVIYGAKIILKHDELVNLERWVRQLNRCYMWLARHACSIGECRWALVPKHHYLCEMMLQAHLINPRYVQCYKGESLVGRGCKFFRASMNGPFHATVQRTVLNRYVIALFISSLLRVEQL